MKFRMRALQFWRRLCYWSTERSTGLPGCLMTLCIVWILCFWSLSGHGEEIPRNFIRRSLYSSALKDDERKSSLQNTNTPGVQRKSAYISPQTKRNQLSSNISSTLDILLKNYNNDIRPGLDQKKLTVIRVNMLIRSMGPISEKDMEYSLDCYLRQEWRDERLRYRSHLEKLSLDIKMLDSLWKPDTFFRNGLGSHIHTLTRPNKLFRIDRQGNILYSMRLTIKAKCPMKLNNFPMDVQSCPLLIGSYAYDESNVRYEWDPKYVAFVPGMTLSQFDILNTRFRNYSLLWQNSDYSVLEVNFILQRNSGYFLIQVYVPCILIVVLSWVSFWINREATSDRVGLGITTVLTLSTISLDTRTDLPKVHYATALDWFILLSFGYCIATLLQFAGVHYFTKVGSGEVNLDEDIEHPIPEISLLEFDESSNDHFHGDEFSTRSARHCWTPECTRRASAAISLNDARKNSPGKRSTETQTDRHDTFCSQLMNCMSGNDQYRKERQVLASQKGSMNSVSLIDNLSRILFPLSYALINVWYWYSYYYYSQLDAVISAT